MDLDEQLRLQSQFTRPEDQQAAAGFGPGTPQYANYRQMIDRGEAIAREMDPAWMGSHPFAAGGAGWAALVNMGAVAAGGGLSGSGGLSEVKVPSAGNYLPAQSMSGQAASTLGMSAPADAAEVGTGIVPEGASSGWQNQIKRLFHMGGNQQQRQPYRYQNPQVADYAQQQQAAEMLAEALNKRQPVDPIVRGGPIPIGRY